MSSQPTIISIVDQVDPNIVVKINGIATASRTAALEVANLQVALASISSSTGLNSLSSALAKINTQAVATGPNVSNLSKALGQITTTTNTAANAGSNLVSAYQLLPAIVRSSDDALVNMAFALRNVSNGTLNIPELANAIQLISPVAKASDAALLGMAQALSGVTNEATLAQRIGRELVDAYRLLPPQLKSSDDALTNMAFSLRSVSNGTVAVKPLSDAIKLLQPAVKQSDAALVGMAQALSGVANTASLAERTGTTLADAFRLLPAVAQKSDSQLLNMAFALRAVQPAASAAGAAADTFGSRLANLLARVFSAQAGFGRLGGAIGALAGSIIGLGPLIIAALALIAIAGAVILYEKFRAEANKLADTQGALGKQLGATSDKLLQQKERFVELTQGPIAKYSQALKDLRFESSNVDFSTILKELEEQHSWWARIDATVEHVVANVIKYGSFKLAEPSNTGSLFDIRDAELYLRQLQAAREQGTLTQQVTKADLQKIVADSKDAANQITFDRKKSLEQEIVALRDKIQIEESLSAGQSGHMAEISNVSLNALRKAYQADLVAYREYLGKKSELGAEQAKASAEEQLKQFNEERDRLKASIPDQVITAQQELQLRQQQIAGSPRATQTGGLDNLAALSGPLGGNIRKVTDEIVKLNAEINQQGFIINNLVQKYQDTITKAGAYSDQMKEQSETEKILLELQQKRIPITDELKKRIQAVTNGSQEQLRVGREQVAIYNEFQGPLQKYNDSLAATLQLLHAEAITLDQANVAVAKSARAYKDAVDPLNEYRIGLEHEIGLLNQYGDALQVATQVDQVRQQLQAKGYDLDQKNTRSLTELLTKMQEMRQVQEEETRLWEQSAGAEQKIVVQQKALDKAYADEVITLKQWKSATLEAALAQNQLNNAIHGGTFATNVIQIYGSLITEFHNLQNVGHQVTQALDKDWGQFFGNLEHGFATSFGRALVYNEDLKTALLDTARNAVAQLISSLIELGIQFVIVTALEKLFHIKLPEAPDAKKQAESLAIALGSIAAITAVQLAAINVLMGPAWALAEAVSLFSFGANAIPAESGIAAVVAAGTGASASGGLFAEGGLITGPGTGTSDSIPIMASAGEFVINAKATTKHRDVLEAINRDADVTQLRAVAKARFASGGIVESMKVQRFAEGGLIQKLSGQKFAGGGIVTNVWHTTPDTSGSEAVKANAMHVSTSVQMKVNVVHDGSTNVEVQQIDENTVTVIAKREAKSAVQSQAASVVAADLHNPNSITSKAVQRNVVAPRRR